MRLITWNVNGRVRALPAQVEAIANTSSHIVVLQEIIRSTAPIFQAELEKCGFPYFVDSFRLAPRGQLFTGPRRYGQLIASRWPIKALPPSQFAVPWPERILSAVVNTPHGKLELHTTHIPPGSTNGWIKIEMLEGLYARLARSSRRLGLLCGDFNTPRRETTEGQVVTWGKAGSRWDQGERNVLVGLAEHGLVDVYRHQHGYPARDCSWYARPEIGYRFDHIFASRALLPKVNCWYLHSVRQDKLSDHSALIAEFRPPRGKAKR